jgi:glycosyltransferase involved in cell wall biosynthesis
MVTPIHNLKIAFLGDYPPRKCGIATFTRDLRNAVAQTHPKWSCPVVSVTDPGRSYEYPPEVRFEIPESDLQSYLRAADFLNLSRLDVLCLQHEFGIFGGRAGSHIVALLRRARIPKVTTLHTILDQPTPEQRRSFREVLDCSNRLVVMTQRGVHILRETYAVPAEKISLIPHGIPDLPFVDPNFYKDQFDIAGRPVLLTFGLLSPGKGIEYAIRALPEIVRQHPDVVYVVLGATHPNLLREQGETYRIFLERLTKELGVQENVLFINRYLEPQDLYDFISAADIYLTPYLNPTQITSGTLAFCFGSGKAVISTPYWHAEELLSEGRGVLVPFRDPGAIAAAALDLLGQETKRHAMRKQAFLLGREMTWPQVGLAYAHIFEEVRHLRQAGGSRPQGARISAGSGFDLPPWRFDHLERMTDSTGMFQHAIFSVPWFEHGYCTDDNARALILTTMLEELDEETPVTSLLQAKYAAFLQQAFVAKTGRFRNFLGFDRRWLEDEGSEDSHGRALWALGAVVGRTRQENLRGWAISLFERSLKALPGFTSPRALAFAILGLHEYMRVLHGDLMANRLRLDLSQRLFDQFQANASPDWPWLEDIVSYDNARLPQALIQTGRWTAHDAMKEQGLRSLRWLMDHQRGSAGAFRPVGSNGFWPRGQEPAQFDQQPVEAAAAVSACIEAFNLTGDPAWQKDALRAFDWFLGYNDLRLPLYDATTGGCFDGLHSNRPNLNQGAESTLAFLVSLAEMKSLQSATASFGGASAVPS